jgi:hypothetical protein
MLFFFAIIKLQMPSLPTNKLVNFLALFCCSGVLVLVLLFSPLNSLAASINLQDSVIAPGAFSSSLHFQLNSALSQIAIDTSATANFKNYAGWLYFPMVSSPVVSGTAGDSQVALSWTPAVGYLGWTVTSYDVGWDTSATGPFTFIANGLSTSYTKTTLTNDTPYYFLVRVKDAFGNVVASSSVISVTPVATVTPPGGGGGGGGGGSGDTGAIFMGRAYPLSNVNLLRDGQIVATTKAGPDANFTIRVTGLLGGQYNFGVNSSDSSGYQSVTQSFPVTLSAGTVITIGGIFIPPSIDVDKSEVKQGDNIAIFGQSVPNGEVTISVHSNVEIFTKTKTDKVGAYLYNFDTVPLEMGNHLTKSKGAVAGEISQFGQAVGFKVGTQNVSKSKSQKCPAKGDLNSDCRVNLVDFSIGAYWYKRTLSGAIIQTEKAKLNGDGKINLTDFSIIAYYWSG